MNIPVKPSEKMDSCIMTGKMNERKLIRMPKKFREMIEHDIGEFVYARAEDGSIITLMVENAYTEDVENDDMYAYVATEIHNLIVGKSSNDADIEPVQGITLGCDPELILVDTQGFVIPASKFLKKWTPVGYDGLLLELRPLPSTDENTVAHNLFKLMSQMRPTIPKEIKTIAVSAYHATAKVTPKFNQAVKLTAGFHLHYGLPKELLGYPKRFIADQIVKALDYYVGIPAMIPEGYDDSYRRSVPYVEYGKPGTYRIDDRTLEYRVPGGILMRHPIWAAGLIGLGAAVIEDLVSRIKHTTEDFSDLAAAGSDEAIRYLYPNLPPAMEIFRCICSPTADFAKAHLNHIYSDVEKMIGYTARAVSINNFFNTLENTYSLNVEENWWRHYGQRQSGQMDVL